MARTHGRRLRGARLRMGFPHGHWKTTTFVAGLTLLTLRGMIAPFVLSGPINRDAFEACVEKVLVPELRPGDVVVIDNLSGHKSPRTCQLIEAASERQPEVVAACAKAYEDAGAGGVPWWQELQVKIPAGVLVLFLLATLGTLYRYNLRMLGFYHPRTDALELMALGLDREQFEKLATTLGPRGSSSRTRGRRTTWRPRSLRR